MKNKKLSFDYVIRNVISTADLKQSVEITKFSKYPWGIFDNEIYGGRCGYVKDEPMTGRVTVFTSGKLISTGAKSELGSGKQLNRTMNLLSDNGFINPVQLRPKIRNVVATFDYNKRIDFQSIISIKTAIYEPEEFPGLVYKSPVGPTCLIFASGKIVIVGARSENQIKETIEDLKILIS